jgi:hypothetical protein
VNLRFFIIGGVVMIISAGLQLLTRRRDPAAGSRRGADATVVKAVFFVIVGVAAVLVGLGVIPLLRMR